MFLYFKARQLLHHYNSAETIHHLRAATTAYRNSVRQPQPQTTNYSINVFVTRPSTIGGSRHQRVAYQCEIDLACNILQYMAVTLMYGICMYVTYIKEKTAAVDRTPKCNE